jgi:hypothetical protein
MTNNNIHTFKGKKYNFSEELNERWQFLTTKITYAEQENHDELFRGCLIMFDCEFKKYESKS